MTKRFGLLEDGEERLDYGSYLKVRELIALQELRSEAGHHEETLFIIIHQTYELWFKQILHELDATIAHMAADRALAAERLLRRCVQIQRVLIHQVDVLETMTPTDFLGFRDHLRPASGFQSAQFREIEFLAGLRDPAHLGSYHAESAERARLAERLGAGSLGDAFYDLLRRRGFRLPEDPPEGDDPAASPEHRERIAELVRLYREPDQAYDLFLLAESMIELDEMFALWRLRHVKMVERMIGSRPGTGGSSGSAYLWKTVDRKFFPDLWELRSELSAEGEGY